MWRILSRTNQGVNFFGLFIANIQMEFLQYALLRWRPLNSNSYKKRRFLKASFVDK